MTLTIPPGTPSDNLGKLMTRRIKARDGSTVILSYLPADAQALRKLAQSITLKAGKKPSLSLLSRRALAIYSSILTDSTLKDAEVAALNRMTTPTPKPAARSKKKASAIAPE